MFGFLYFFQVRHWLTVHGITLVFGPVTLKAWRVHCLFKYGFGRKVVSCLNRFFAKCCSIHIVFSLYIE